MQRFFVAVLLGWTALAVLPEAALACSDAGLPRIDPGPQPPRPDAPDGCRVVELGENSCTGHIEYDVDCTPAPDADVDHGLPEPDSGMGSGSGDGCSIGAGTTTTMPGLLVLATMLGIAIRRR